MKVQLFGVMDRVDTTRKMKKGHFCFLDQAVGNIDSTVIMHNLIVFEKFTSMLYIRIEKEERQLAKAPLKNSKSFQV